MQDFWLPHRFQRLCKPTRPSPHRLWGRGTSISLVPQVGSQSMKAEHPWGFGESQQGADRVLVPNSSSASRHDLVH